MLTLLSSMILRSIAEQADFPDHLKDHSDRYIRNPHSRRMEGVTRHDPLPFRGLW